MASAAHLRVRLPGKVWLRPVLGHVPEREIMSARYSASQGVWKKVSWGCAAFVQMDMYVKPMWS